jgi:hypothetical protein
MRDCKPSAQHLKRYVAEFDFRYNHRVALGVDDFDRTLSALLGAKGKRLMYSEKARFEAERTAYKEAKENAARKVRGAGARVRRRRK